MWNRHDMANQVWYEEDWVWHSMQDSNYVLDLKFESGIGKIIICYPIFKECNGSGEHTLPFKQRCLQSGNSAYQGLKNGPIFSYGY